MFCTLSPPQQACGGRPSKLSSTDVRHALRLIGTGKADNAVQVTRALAPITNNNVHPQTMRRHLKQAGMKAVHKQKKPLLTLRHQKNRLDFAIAHQHWTIDDWKRLVWSDETKINCLGSDGRKWVWKKPGEALTERLVEKTLKFGGGSVMIWGCMLWDGPGFACKIDGKMDGDLYVKILDEELTQSINYYGYTKDDIIFQQDNDPKHTCKKAKEWFDDHEYNVMVWPANSPDLNPIEHLWEHLKRQLAGYEQSPKGVLELWERIEKEWNAIPAPTCQTLIESMPRRVEAVLKAKGGYTKY